MSYDGYGRLTNYTRTDVGSNDFTYNGLDDRVEMALSTAGTSHFIYDASGRVMGEYGASASDVQAEFIWASPQVGQAGPFGGDDGVGGYAPLAVATPDASSAIVINWVHGNHIGVPLLATDSSGSTSTTPDDYLLPGFPGQSRVFADLYYNRYRDYDPVTGRYIQADPIGLGGGSNNYLYANANPVIYVDPEGKNPIIAAIIIGGFIGALIDIDLQLLQGRDPRCIDWQSVGASALLGGATGGLFEVASPFLGRAISGISGKAAKAAEDVVPASTPIGRRGNPINVKRGTNSDAVLGGREYDGHALDRMQGRGVMPSVVENTISIGRASPDPIPGRIRFYDAANNMTVVTESNGRVVTVINGKR